MRFTPEEIVRVRGIASELYRSSGAVREMVDGPLRKSGTNQRAASSVDFFAEAWQVAADGLNHLIDVYTGAREPLYPEIDSPLEDPSSDAYGALVDLALRITADDLAPPDLFFEPSLRFALALLDLNGFDHAARLEPLEQGENRAAIARARTIRWQDYAYSAIVVPGASLPMRRLRVMLAVRRFQDRLAPFLIVSGGAVRPPRTSVMEAVEMKRQLMEEFRVPEDAILIDPHARHTTTNLRNAAREIFRYGFPFEKEVLVTTDPDQSGNIGSALFAERCRRELGYLPVEVKRRISEFDLAVVPRLDSLQQNPLDPLDP